MQLSKLITAIALLSLNSCAATTIKPHSGQYSFYRLQMQHETWPELADQLQGSNQLQLRINAVRQHFSNKEQVWLLGQPVQLQAGHYQLQTDSGLLSVRLMLQEKNWLVTLNKAEPFSRQELLQLLSELKLSSTYKLPTERYKSYLSVRDIFIM